VVLSHSVNNRIMNERMNEARDETDAAISEVFVCLWAASMQSELSLKISREAETAMTESTAHDTPISQNNIVASSSAVSRQTLAKRLLRREHKRRIKYDKPENGCKLIKTINGTEDKKRKLNETNVKIK